MDHISIDLPRGRQPVPGDILAKLGAKRRCAFVVPYFAVALSMVPGTSLVFTVGRTVADAMRDQAGTRVIKAMKEIRRYRFIMIWPSAMTKILVTCDCVRPFARRRKSSAHGFTLKPAPIVCSPKP